MFEIEEMNKAPFNKVRILIEGHSSGIGKNFGPQDEQIFLFFQKIYLLRFFPRMYNITSKKIFAQLVCFSYIEYYNEKRKFNI